MADRMTVGEQVNKTIRDPTKYNAREVGMALTEDVLKEIEICVERHVDIFDEPVFCVVMLLCTDNLLPNLMRRKFYAQLFLPKPRPSQLVMLYNKFSNKLIRLWCLPDAMTMATIDEMSTVIDAWKLTKQWVRWFYEGWALTGLDEKSFKYTNKNPKNFFNKIREQHGITLESEKEYLDAHRHKLIKSGCQLPQPGVSDPFDFGKIKFKSIIEPFNASG